MSARPAPFQHGFWIGSDHPFDLHEVYLCFRSPPDWHLPERPGRARLWITADSRYRLWINGQPAGRGPARSWPHAQQVDVLEVQEMLRPGPNNHLAVQVYQPGYSHFAYVHRGAAGLLAALEVDGQVVLATDGSWRVRRDPSFHAQVHRISIYGSGVEDRDLAQVEDWTDPHFDDRAWAPARIVAPAEGPLWRGLRPRQTPLLEERTLPVAGSKGTFRLVECRRGQAPEDTVDPHEVLRRLWTTAHPTALADPADGWYRVRLSPGDGVAWLVDLGRAHTCQGWAEIQGARGGEQLLIGYVDRRVGGQVVLSDPRTYCRMRVTDRFRLRPGSQVAQGFGMRGGRFLFFALLGSGPADLAVRLQVTTATYPLEVTRPLHTGDGLLDDVVALCENTVRACLQDTFVDCVWREASQWLGDALPQALALSAMGDDLRPLRVAIQMAAEGAYPDGVLPSVLPSEAHAYTVLDYNFTWVELLRLHHRLSGDRGFLAQMWPVLVRMLARFREDRGPDGLLRSQPGRRLFLDWAPLSRNEPSAVYNLRYLRALQLAGQEWEGMDPEWKAAVAAQQRTWQEEAQALARTIRAAFWDGERWWDDLERTTHSQLAAALALLCGLVRAAERPRLLDALTARSLDPEDGHRPGEMVLASPFMHHYVLEALYQAGRHQEVRAIIRARWGRWVQAGHPTAWENWDVDFPDGSQCHAFSAHPRYHLARLAAAEHIP